MLSEALRRATISDEAAVCCLLFAVVFEAGLNTNNMPLFIASQSTGRGAGFGSRAFVAGTRATTGVLEGRGQPQNVTGARIDFKHISSRFQHRSTSRSTSRRSRTQCGSVCPSCCVANNLTCPEAIPRAYVSHERTRKAQGARHKDDAQPPSPSLLRHRQQSLASLASRRISFSQRWTFVRLALECIRTVRKARIVVLCVGL